MALNFTKKLFWIIALFIIFANIFGTLHRYKETQNLIYETANDKALLLKTYFVSMRYIYHHQFLKSNLEIDDNTVGFLPAHASALISDHFSQAIQDGTTIRNVTDKPRNPINRADSFEEESMRYFLQNPQTKSRTQLINHKGEEYFFYTSPLHIQPYCLACHGSKEEVLPFVSKRYDSAYDYKSGDLRGLTSIKIPMQKLSEESMGIFYNYLFFSWFTTLFLLLIIYYTIRKITEKEVDAKIALQKEVYKKTAYLEKSIQKQTHLFNILRTVADCNQVLITASSLKELINETSRILYANSAFDGVKLIIEENGALHVKSSLGLNEELEVLSYEAEVFHLNKNLMLDNFAEFMPADSMEKIEQHGLKALYCVTLIHSINAQKALGVMSICTKQDNGFTDEEKAMILELAGDIGFAINSYMQKAQIQKLSHYHPLTELPNKTLLIKNLLKLQESSEKEKIYAALLYINIDNFKAINDLKSVKSGDKLLQNISERLRGHVGLHDDIYHIGGDEFVITTQLSSYLEHSTFVAEKYAQELLQTLNAPFILDGHDFYITSCIGIVLFVDTKYDPDFLINQAQSAMRLSKKSGKNSVHFYDPNSQRVAVERSIMVQDLRLALRDEQFFMLYQKQVDSTLATVGVEALVRWRHPHLGIVSPVVFIPILEESGLIIELGSWIFKESVAQLAAWSRESDKARWLLSVNVSPLQFNDPEFVSIVDTIVQNAGISHDRIRIEITEGVLINNIDEVTSKIDRLKTLGFSISIDDFGTGYSSLSYLKALPIDEVKIDQSFVKNLAENSSDKTIVKTILDMAQSFEFEVIAEGVETQEQLEILQSLGCNRFQGYYFAKPQEASEL